MYASVLYIHLRDRQNLLGMHSMKNASILKSLAVNLSFDSILSVLFEVPLHVMDVGNYMCAKWKKDTNPIAIESILVNLIFAHFQKVGKQ